MFRTKKVRIVCFVMVVVFTVALLFTGCGTNKQVETKAAESSQKAVETTKEELKPVELSWYVGGPQQPDLQNVLDGLNMQLKEKINANLKLEIVDFGSYDQKMKMKIAAGEEFDLCLTTLSWINKYLPNVAKGAFLPLDDLLAKYAPKYKESIPQKFWDAAKVNGKIYGALNYQIFAQQRGFYANKKLVEKYNFDYKNVKKLEDLEPFMDNILMNEKDITPVGIFKTFGVPISNLQNNFLYDPVGVKFNDANLKVFIVDESNEFKEFINLMRKWYLKGYIRKDAASLADNTDDKKAGKFAMFPGTIKPGGEIEVQNQNGYEVVSIPMQQPHLINTSILATMTAISMTSKNPERAMMLLELLNTDKKLFNTLVYGMEGKHYNKISEDTIEIIKDGGYINAAWKFGNQFNAYYQKGQKPGIWEETKKLNSDAIPSPLLGFNFDPEPVKSEMAQLQSVYNEFIPGLTTGTLDPAKSLPEYINKLKTAGIDKVIQETQKQIDEWKKTK